MFLRKMRSMRFVFNSKRVNSSRVSIERLTCVSVRWRDDENSALSAIVRYCFSRNFFSSDNSCCVVNGVLGLRFGLCFRRVHLTGPGPGPGSLKSPETQSGDMCSNVDAPSSYFIRIKFVNFTLKYLAFSWEFASCYETCFQFIIQNTRFLHVQWCNTERLLNKPESNRNCKNVKANVVIRKPIYRAGTYSRLSRYAEI